jgi:hypothetical protein
VVVFAGDMTPETNVNGRFGKDTPTEILHSKCEVEFADLEPGRRTVCAWKLAGMRSDKPPTLANLKARCKALDVAGDTLSLEL